MLEQKEALAKEGHRVSNMKDLSEVIHQFALFPNDLLYVTMPIGCLPRLEGSVYSSVGKVPQAG